MRNALRAFTLLAAGLAAFFLASPQASAASAAAATINMKDMLSGATSGSLTEKAQYGRRYRRWRNRCRRRWGYGPRYRRCMRRHGFYGRGRYNRRYRHCRRWRHRCRRRWGGGPRYRRCMRNHGCRRFY